MKLSSENTINYSLMAIALTLPIGRSTIWIIVLFLFAIYHHINSNNKTTILQLLKDTNILFYYFILVLLGLLYSSNLGIGLSIVERNLSFLIIPISFSLIKGVNIWVDKILLAFSASVIGIVLSAHISILYKIVLSNGSLSLLFTHYIREDFLNNAIVHIHAPYFGMFTVFTLTIILKTKILPRYLKLILSVYLIFSIYEISGLTSIITTFILLAIIMYNQIIKKKSALWIFAIAIMIISTSIATITVVNNQDNINDSNFIGRLENLINRGGDSDRAENWVSILKIPKLNYIFGVGTGDELQEIQKVRNKDGWAWAYNHKANMHNQYLEILLRNGLVGLIFFLFILFTLWRKSLSIYDFRFVAFVIIFSTSIISESMLERQWGIIFFAVFSSLLLSIKNNSSVKP